MPKPPETEREFEAWLRTEGYSHKHARFICEYGYEAYCSRFVAKDAADTESLRRILKALRAEA